MRKKIFHVVLASLALAIPFSAVNAAQAKSFTLTCNPVTERIGAVSKSSISAIHTHKYRAPIGPIRIVTSNRTVIHKSYSNYSYAHVDIYLRTAGTLRYAYPKCVLVG